VEALAGLARSYVGEVGICGVAVVVRGTGGEEWTLLRDGGPAAPGRVSVGVSVVRDGREFSLLEVSANREEGGRPGLSDAVGSLADGVRAFLEAHPRQGPAW
jgi:hypothetical protein